MKTSKLIAATVVALLISFGAGSQELADFSALPLPGQKSIVEQGFGDQTGAAYVDEARGAGFDVMPRTTDSGGLTYYEDRSAYVFFSPPPVYWVNGFQGSTMQEACNRSGSLYYPGAGWTYRLFNQGGSWMCRVYTPSGSFWVQQGVWRQPGPTMIASNSFDRGIAFFPVALAMSEADKARCESDCNWQKTKDDANLAGILAEMKGTYVTTTSAVTVGAGLIASMIPGVGKVGAGQAAAATYLVAKAHLDDLLDARKRLGDVTNTRRFFYCMKFNCGKN